MGDPVVAALFALLHRPVTRRELRRDDGRRLTWVEVGSGEPPVVLVAGAGETLLDWAVVLPDLANLGRVVAYDRAGLGDSDRIGRLTVEATVADLAALLRETGPAVVVGHSWGGLLAQLVAVAARGSVLGLILVDPSHEDVTAAVPWRARAAGAAMLNAAVAARLVGLFGRIARGMGTALAARCTDDAATRALIVDAYVASYRRLANVLTIRAENRLLGSSVSWLRARRAPLPDVPVTVLTATRGKAPSLQARSAVLGEAVAASAPRGEQVVVADAGHYVHHDQPAVVVAAVVATLDRVRA